MFMFPQKKRKTECLPDSKHGQSLGLEIMKCKARQMSSMYRAGTTSFLSNKLVQSKCWGFMEGALFLFQQISRVVTTGVSLSWC